MNTFTIPEEIKEQYRYAIMTAREKRGEYIDWIKTQIETAITLINKFDKIHVLGSFGARLIKATPTLASNFLESYDGPDKEHATSDMVEDDDSIEVLLEYAMSLATATENNNKGVIPSDKDIEEIYECLSTIKTNFIFLELSTDIPKDTNQFEHWLTTNIKQETMNVRGNGYQIHVAELYREMFQPHDGFLDQYYNFNSEDLYNTIIKLDGLIYSKVGNMTGSRYAHKRFLEWSEQTGDEVISNTMRDAGKHFIRQFTEANPDLFDESMPDQIAVNHLDNIETYSKVFWVIPKGHKEELIFDRLALEFKDNNNFFIPPRFKGFILNDTLIKLKPIIKESGKYYNFSLNLGYRNIFKITEELLKSADPVYFENSFKNNSNSNSRDNFIERKTKELFQKMLPGVRFYHSLDYDIIEDGIAKKPELDILGISTDTIYIIEVKAGELNEKHRRGALKGLKDRLEETINEGSYQCQRALNYIQNTERPTFEYIENRTRNVLAIDKTAITSYHKISVTYDYFSFISTNLRYLINAGILSPDFKWTWIVSMYDLMVFADLIQNEDDFKDYLINRVGLYERTDVEFSDEVDVLGFFLENKFPLEEQKENEVLHIINYKDKIDSYYNNLSLGVPNNPKPIRTK